MIFSISSSLVSVVFFGIFALVLVFITITIIRMAGMSKKNTALPRIAAPATVIAHRTFSADGATRTYFMTFEYKTGDRAEYAVTSDTYSYYADGDEGTLTVQGTKFISFVI